MQESIIYMSGTIKVCMDHLFYWFILPEVTYSSFIIYVDHKEPVLPVRSKQPSKLIITYITEWWKPSHGVTVIQLKAVSREIFRDISE